MEQVRSFIAIKLPEDIKAGLKKIEDTLKSTDPICAKWVDSESIHLTLKFLGNVDVTKIDAIVQSMKEAAKAISTFRLIIKGLGAFPDFKQVRIVWVGIEGDTDKLQMLQQNIESYIARLGFPTEKRPFTPHLTLARVREFATPQERQSLGETIAKIKIESNLIIKVDFVNLMRSQLTRTGAIYTCLSSIMLNPSC